jgi:hypothetical protein
LWCDSTTGGPFDLRSWRNKATNLADLALTVLALSVLALSVLRNKAIELRIDGLPPAVTGAVRALSKTAQP